MNNRERYGSQLQPVSRACRAKKMARSKVCDLCLSQISDTRNRRTLSTSKCATAALDGLIADVSLGASRMQLLPSGQVCRKCYQDLEKLGKARTTVSDSTACFVEVLGDARRSSPAALRHHSHQRPAEREAQLILSSLHSTVLPKDAHLQERGR